jgi:hypothetical protein
MLRDAASALPGELPASVARSLSVQAAVEQTTNVDSAKVPALMLVRLIVMLATYVTRWASVARLGVNRRAA